jgi:uncharacterized membrane protein
MSLLFPRSSHANRHPANIRHTGDQRSLGERVADTVAARVGSWPFIIVQTTLLVMWLIANGFLIHAWLGDKPFDPYPFILLNLMLSFQAAYTGPVVMMSQNRQSARDRDEAEHDYEVNRRSLAALRDIQQKQAELEELITRLSNSSRKTTTNPSPRRSTER